MQLIITIKNADKIEKKLRRLGSSLTDLSSAMEAIGRDASEYYRDQVFASQGGALGAVWPRLSPRTIASKTKRYPQFVNTPLVATGKMRDSFTYSADRTSVRIGNNANYYKYHQSSAPRRRLPRRRMAGINPYIRKMVGLKIADSIRRKLQVV